MAGFDIFLAVVVGLCFIFSIFKGMVREIFSVLSLVAGYVVAARYHGVGADWLAQYITNDTLARVTSFGALFIVTAVAVSILGFYVKKVIHISEILSGFDRLGGGAFGVVKGVLFVVLLMFPLQLYPDLYVKVTRGSVSAPHLKSLSNDIVKALDAQDGFVDGLKKKKRELEKLDIIKDLSDKFKKSVKKSQDDHTASDQQELNKMLDSINNEEQK